MSDKPLMPKATAVWLVENTKISFKQIADFCNLHELEVKGIADGDVAKGIKAYNPILAGQLTREEIEASSVDNNRPLILNRKTLRKYVNGVSITWRMLLLIYYVGFTILFQVPWFLLPCLLLFLFLLSINTKLPLSRTKK